MKKSRGKFLTIMIVLAAIGMLQTLYYLTNTNLIEEAYGAVPSWYPLYSVFGLIWGVVTVYGLWMMKKWAAYMLLASTVLAFAIQLFVLKPLLYAQFTYFLTMISAGVWFWAIYRKWNDFT